MFLEEGPSGKSQKPSWGAVAKELQQKNWKTPGGGGKQAGFGVVALDDGGVGLHKSRWSFREVKDMREKRIFFARVSAPNIFKRMDPQTHGFYFTDTPLQGNA